MPRGYRFDLMIFHKPDLDCWGSSVIPFLSSYPYTHLNYSRVGVTEKQAIKWTIGLRMFIFNDAFVSLQSSYLYHKIDKRQIKKETSIIKHEETKMLKIFFCLRKEVRNLVENWQH